MGAQSSKIAPNTALQIQSDTKQPVMQSTVQPIIQPTTSTLKTYYLPFTFNYIIHDNNAETNNNEIAKDELPEHMLELLDKMINELYDKRNWKPYLSNAMQNATGNKLVRNIVIDFNIIEEIFIGNTYKGKGTGLVIWTGAYGDLKRVQDSVHSILNEKMAVFGFFEDDYDGNELWRVYIKPQQMYEPKQGMRNISALRQTLAAKGTFEGKNKTRKNLPQELESISAQSIAPFLTGPGYEGFLPEQLKTFKRQLKGGKRCRQTRKNVRKSLR